MCRIPPKRDSPGLEWDEIQSLVLTWDCSERAGFTSGRPWLPLGADHRTVNVEVEETHGASILNLYRRLIAFRRAHPLLVGGVLRSVTASGNLLNYERVADNERLLILLNFGNSPVRPV